MPDARQVMDDLLSGNDYVFPMSGLGTLDPRSVHAVLRVALYEQTPSPPSLMHAGVTRAL